MRIHVAIGCRGGGGYVQRLVDLPFFATPQFGWCCFLHWFCFDSYGFLTACFCSLLLHRNSALQHSVAHIPTWIHVLFHIRAHSLLNCMLNISKVLFLDIQRSSNCCLILAFFFFAQKSCDFPTISYFMTFLLYKKEGNNQFCKTIKFFDKEK